MAPNPQQRILDDAAAIFAAGLAQSVDHTYLSPEGQETTESVDVIFNAPHNLSMQEMVPASSALPYLYIQTVEAGNVENGSWFTIGGVRYYVAEAKPAQSGIAEVVLTKDQETAQ